MKSLFIVILSVFVLGLTSCEKERICPNDDKNEEDKKEDTSFDFFRSNRLSNTNNGSINKDLLKKDTSDEGDLNDSNFGEANSTGNGVEVGAGEITDPNDDPDASKRKGKK